MSQFSGKCDLYDWFYGKQEEDLKNYKIYAAGNIIPLKIETIKDLVPYYPYLVASAGWNDGRGIIHLSSSSFVDREEEETLTLSLESLLRYYRRCKRKHVPYEPEEAVRHCFGSWGAPEDLELAQRVSEDGEKATIQYVHSGFAFYYRNKLFEEMLIVGYTPFEAAHWVHKDDWAAANKLIKEYERGVLFNKEEIRKKQDDWNNWK